ncbi:lysophosphatidylcholine acyltransferase [Ceratitis capitata]|uniref:1-acylglycerophosphocholine O-acyltransferase 1 n=1 Tax=Ceratitis capitata TaxID=7213 RepID=W8C9M2_CERCA|nr:lysophosphatidylcholine acyltransferase [Ceratitis capitata]XP_012160940.1 lysophosphatidylcholine acyltransferase [Ceratitis capitata]XP_012160941.1 lysophosphatidylcholine acyltransferase [Ceratitis capitata]XP_012160942.1 lysophosphatidylcholine acyltransferase [Ceratitis capitata]
MTTSAFKSKRNNAAPNDAEADGHISNNVHATDTMEKTDSEEDTWSSTGYNYINPFVHRLQIDNSIDLAKIYMLTVLLMPIRVVGCVISLLSAWMFACIGLYGLTLDDLKTRPISGWRRQFQRITSGAMRTLFAAGTFHHVKLTGQRASPKEAPIMVVAPHSSYVDSIIVVTTGPPSIVAKRETSDIPLLGKIINFAQPIYVQREDPNSRQNTIREIVDRARSEDEWPQVVIFAEGTCTNRKALIKFKPGAFYPGVPVQPVLLKYPNKYDSFTWTWDGPGVLKLLWMTMAQLYSRCEIEFLPVYTPSEEEIADANLYANNVREVMAKALGVPTSEYSYEDVITMSRAKDMRVPFPGDIVEIERMLYSLGFLPDSARDTEIIADFLSLKNTDHLDIFTFAELLQIDSKNPQLHQLFALLDHYHRYTVNLKSFLICSQFCKLKNEEIIEFLRAITNLYCESSQHITRQNFTRILRHSGKLTPDKCDALYFAVDRTNRGYITFEDFEHYTKDHPQYKFLYAKQEHLRRTQAGGKVKKTH